jgi:hypothetical protein
MRASCERHRLAEPGQKVHYEFHAIIVQLGFSKAKAEQSHLELFFMDTWRMTLRILASP